MKKPFLMVALCFAALASTVLPASAQHAKPHHKMWGTGKAKPAFDKGSKTLGFSVGFGVDYGYAYTGYTSLPAFCINYDQGIIGNVGPGTIGIGGIVGWKGEHYDETGGYSATWTNIIVGLRGTYHLTILKVKNNKFDPYAGITTGVRIWSYSDGYLDHSGLSYTGHDVYPFVGAFVGAKYNFTPHFGAFAELGYDISFFRIGLCANF